jgi:hypothetical protein
MPSVPSQNVACSQATVTSSASLIVGSRTDRKRVTLVMHGTVDTFIGNSTGVTVNNGALLAGVKGQTLTFETAAAIYGINGSTVVVGVIEEFA